MGARIERLDWDSAFFGVPIVRVRSDASDDLDAVAREADADDVACTYLMTEPPSIGGAGAPEQAGFFLVDVQLELVRSLQDAIAHDHAPVRAGRPADAAGLDPVLDELAPWSRFAVDPGFGLAAARRLYGAWLERALRHEDELVLVAEHHEQPIGFVTCAFDPEPTIGLIGTTESGRGTGKALFAGVVARAREHRETRSLHVRTQARNVRALSYYARVGFAVTAAQYVYHRWHDEGPRP
ncbi:MAG: GNAT family N-acetyltransferase [Acidimicrobiia bacterium]